MRQCTPRDETWQFVFVCAQQTAEPFSRMKRLLCFDSRQAYMYFNTCEALYD